MPAQQKLPPPETIVVAADVDEVCCDGGSPVLGHPVVWYAFGDNDRVECGYCDRVFIKES
jgi:uncharacterized Zn-finger protein